jgi:predicted MPP superfamily phosphohydrolase
MIVSRGLGTHTFPVRIGNPAEIVEIEFRGV